MFDTDQSRVLKETVMHVGMRDALGTAWLSASVPSDTVQKRL